VEKAHRARTFALSIVGVDATPDKRQRCLDEIHSLGAHLDGSAPVRAKLLLAPQNALRITSVKRGVVLRESLGSWIVPQLCKEVTLRALAALSRERDDA